VREINHTHHFAKRIKCEVNVTHKSPVSRRFSLSPRRYSTRRPLSRVVWSDCPRTCSSRPGYSASSALSQMSSMSHFLLKLRIAKCWCKCETSYHTEETATTQCWDTAEYVHLSLCPDSLSVCYQSRSNITNVVYIFERRPSRMLDVHKTNIHITAMIWCSIKRIIIIFNVIR